MKANELTIGDWVRSPKNADGDFYTAQVSEIKQGGEHYYCYIPGPDGNDSIRCDDLSPVPLTGEILEKNGWRFNDIPFVNGWEQFGLTICGGMILCGQNVVLDVSAVHKLQQVLRLCGIEKEIVL